MFTRSCTAMAPPRIVNGTMPNWDWSIARCSTRRDFVSGSSILHRNVHRAGDSVQCDGDLQRLTRCRSPGAFDGDQRVGIAIGLEHPFQHIAPGPRDVGGRRLRVEPDLRPQRGLVDDERIERNIEVGAPLARSDEPGDVVTRDHMVVPELRQRAATPDDDDHERTRGIDPKDGRPACRDALVIRLRKLRRLA